MFGPQVIRAKKRVETDVKMSVRADKPAHI
jgi:hypothetical protein